MSDSSLFNVLRRGPPVSVLDTERVISPDFYDSLPVKLNKLAPFGSRDKSMFVQLRRGVDKPNKRPRLLDFDRESRISTQEHGLKVRLNERDQKKIDEIAEDTTSGAARSILAATKQRTDALAKVLDVPISQDVNETKKSLIEKIEEIGKFGMTPTLAKQQEILQVLQQMAVDMANRGNNTSMIAPTMLAPTVVMQGLTSGPDDSKSLDPLTNDEIDEIRENQSQNNSSNQYLKSEVWKVLAGNLGIRTNTTRALLLNQIFSPEYLYKPETQDVLEAVKNGVLNRNSNSTDVFSLLQSSSLQSAVP